MTLLQEMRHTCRSATEDKHSVSLLCRVFYGMWQEVLEGSNAERQNMFCSECRFTEESTELTTAR